MANEGKKQFFVKGDVSSQLAYGKGPDTKLDEILQKFIKKIRNSIDMGQISTVCFLSQDKSKFVPNLHIDHLLFAK